MGSARSEEIIDSEYNEEVIEEGSLNTVATQI
jgi:hypothetical protein